MEHARSVPVGCWHRVGPGGKLRARLRRDPPADRRLGEAGGGWLKNPSANPILPDARLLRREALNPPKSDSIRLFGNNQQTGANGQDD